MKILIILIICFLNINCDYRMTNQEIIDEINFCKKKNMDSELIKYFNGNTYNVICIPLKKECECNEIKENKKFKLSDD